jgi:sugar phosphate isomerase/epimerase
MDYLTLYGAHPLDYVRTCAKAGCAHVAFFLSALDFAGLPPGPPSLFDDAGLRRDVLACLDDHGMSIGLIDGFGIRKGVSALDYRPAFDVLGELGVDRINTAVSGEWEHAVDQATALVDIAAEHGVTVTVEAIPTFTVGSLPEALELLRRVGKPNFKLLIDTMHVSRSGGTSLMATLDPDLISYVQICDAPLSKPAGWTYLEEALHERKIPGEGELPLVQILKHLPPDVIVSMEIPMRSARQAGLSEMDHARLAADGARKVMQAARQASA